MIERDGRLAVLRFMEANFPACVDATAVAASDDSHYQGQLCQQLTS
jgi:hypothetical protein